MPQNRDAQILDAVNKLLVRYSRDSAKFMEQVDRLQSKFGDDIFPHLIFTTAHLEFKKRTAKKHWRAVLKHWEFLRKSIKREIDFRVALLDYFIDVNRRITNPKIIEIKIFQKTQQETLVDELTQLYNYRYFDQALEHELVRANRYHAPLSLVIFDVDDFKHYNDTNGHMAGNRALAKLAQIFKSSIRDVDILCRYGGEEFALILPETNKEGAWVISERIRKKVLRHKFPKEELQPLKDFSISGGVATLHVDAETGGDLMHKADQALYRAKARGKNMIFLYVEERRDSDRAPSSITGRFTIASAAGDIFVVQNISEGGILFQFQKALPIGSTLNLSLNLPQRKTPLTCKAKVKRVEELKKNALYEIGVKLTHMSQAEKKALHRFVKMLLQEEKTD